MTFTSSPNLHGSPRRYGFFYDPDGGQSLPATGVAETQLSLSGTLRAGNAMMTNVDDGDINIHQAGSYQIIAQLTIEPTSSPGNASQNSIDFDLKLNGSTTGVQDAGCSCWMPSTGSRRVTGQFQVIKTLAAGDVLKFFDGSDAATEGVLGTVSSVTNSTTIVLTAGNTEAFDNNDFLYLQSPIKLIFGFEYV